MSEPIQNVKLDDSFFAIRSFISTWNASVWQLDNLWIGRTIGSVLKWKTFLPVFLCVEQMNENNTVFVWTFSAYSVGFYRGGNVHFLLRFVFASTPKHEDVRGKVCIQYKLRNQETESQERVWHFDSSHVCVLLRVQKVKRCWAKQVWVSYYNSK